MVNLSDLEVLSRTMQRFTILADYWSSLQEDGKIPKKSNFNPMKIPSLLPDICVMELLDEDKIIYRLAGTAHTERSGRDLTGANVLDAFPEDIREKLKESFKRSVKIKCGGYHSTSLKYSNSVEIKLECLYLPLCDDNNTIKYSLALFHPVDKANASIAKELQLVSFEISDVIYIDVGYGVCTNAIIPKHTAMFE